jgi:hypothetical protein
LLNLVPVSQLFSGSNDSYVDVSIAAVGLTMTSFLASMLQTVKGGARFRD